MRAKARKHRKAGKDDDPLTLAEGIAILAILSLLGALAFGVVAV